MKYIKLYDNKDIEWEFFDEEEDEVNSIHKLFINFLKENEVYDKFINEFKISRWRRDNPNDKSFHTHDITEYLDHTKPNQYIYNAFPWGSASIWHDMNNDWRRIIRYQNIPF